MEGLREAERFAIVVQGGTGVVCEEVVHGLSNKIIGNGESLVCAVGLGADGEAGTIWREICEEDFLEVGV